MVNKKRKLINLYLFCPHTRTSFLSMFVSLNQCDPPNEDYLILALKIFNYYMIYLEYYEHYKV